MRIKQKEVYLDGAANAPLSKAAAAAMARYLKPGVCGNSSSAHGFGARMDQAVAHARDAIANAMGVAPSEVIFTSGASESNNWAIKATALGELEKPIGERRMRIVVPATEHDSVLAACDSLAPLGFEIIKIKPNRFGRITVPSVKCALKKGKTLLVCCMAVNNETGAANPVDKVAEAAHAAGAAVLCDATQALCMGGETMRLRERFPNVDMFSFSAHKICGPIGVGCLITKQRLRPLISGGGQEFGMRSGTHNVAAISGFAAAVTELSKADSYHRSMMYRIFAGKIVKCLSISMDGDGVRLNVMPAEFNILSIDFSQVVDYPGRMANAFALYGVSVSAGAACSESGDGESPSHVLLSMGYGEDRIRGTVRVSFTRYTTMDDINTFITKAKLLMNLFPKKKQGVAE